MSIGRIDSSPSVSDLLSVDSDLSAALTGDTGAQIAAMLVRSARDSRDLAQGAERAEEQRLTALEDQQVQELREQADATRSAATWSALGQFAVAGAELYCATSGASSGATSAGATLKAGAALAQGAFNLAASEQQFEASIHGANATQADNRAGHAKRRMQDLKEERRDASQLIRSAIETAAELVRTHNATDQATIFLRG